MQRIARRAELTSGLIVHYFDHKEGLYEAVYRELYRRLRADLLARLEQRAASPAERLQAILDAQISDMHVQPEVVATWLALYAMIPERPSLSRIERAYERRLHSTLVDSLKALELPDQEAREIAEELMSLIDGLWPNLANPMTLTPAEARGILRRTLLCRLPKLRS